MPWSAASVTPLCTVSRHLCRERRIARVQSRAGALNTSGIRGLQSVHSTKNISSSGQGQMMWHLVPETASQFPTHCPHLTTNSATECVPYCLGSTSLSAMSPERSRLFALTSHCPSLGRFSSGHQPCVFSFHSVLTSFLEDRIRALSLRVQPIRLSVSNIRYPSLNLQNSGTLCTRASRDFYTDSIIC